MPVFIQDRTVIEDTESSVDLVARGWSLYNYPERLAFSATPPDFGSLLIQRRRWANGGLLILPKLVRYLVARPWRPSKMVEGFFRAHYLLSLAAVNVGVLIVLGHSFESSLETAWVPVAGLPYFFLYARDLRYSGYRLTDCLRVYALNLLLIPVNLGGVLKSAHQGIAGQRTAFGRTPKVNGRTGAPALYVLAEYGMLVWWLGGCVIAVADEHWRSAIFAFANSVALAYAIRRYMGEPENWEDIRTGLSRWVNQGTPVLETSPPPIVSTTHAGFEFTVLVPAPHDLPGEPEPPPEIAKMAERESWLVAGARLWPSSAEARNNGASTASRSKPPAHIRHVA